jgi:hypothetical protein
LQKRHLLRLLSLFRLLCLQGSPYYLAPEVVRTPGSFTTGARLPGQQGTQNAPAACLGFVSGGCAAVNTPATGGAGLLALHVVPLPGKEVAGAAAAAGAGTPTGRSKHRGLDWFH